jgi:hypothetical protein
MNRLAAAAALAACLALAASRARGQDVVEYRDPAATESGKVETLRGTIESESPVGIRVRPKSGPVVEVAASHIRYIRYKAVAASELDYRKPFALEIRALGQARAEQRKKLLGEALDAYRDLLPKAQDSQAGRSYLEYRIARVLAHQAEDDRDRLAAAVDAFAAFGREHADGWEIVPAMKQLAHLREEKGDLGAAGEAYADLARVPGVPAAVRQESQILAARMLLRAGRHADADKKLAELDASLPPTDAARPAIQVFLAQCQLARGDTAGVDARVSAALAHTSDAAVHAAGHNVLGDCYLKKGQPEDAFWEYLKVDVQYDADVEEQAKALYHLSQLFDRVKNDKVRAQECLARLQDKARFGGTEYHKKAAVGQP